MAPIAAAKRPQSGVMSRHRQTADNEALNLIYELEATTETQAQLLVEARELLFTQLQKELAETLERNKAAKVTDEKVVKKIAQLKSNLEKINAFYNKRRANPPASQ